MYHDIEERLVEEVYEILHQQGKSNRKYIGMSWIGGKCLRKSWYKFRGFDEAYSPQPFFDSDPGKMMMIFRFGDLVEEMLVKAIIDTGYTIESTQSEYTDLNGWVKGHSDGVLVDLDGQRYVLEIKSANDNSFKAAEKAETIKDWEPEYHAQINYYMEKEGVSQGLFIVLNKNNCKLLVRKVTKEKSEVNRCKNNSYCVLESNEPPNRCAEVPEDKDCQWCGFRCLCWGLPGFTQTTKTCGTCKHCERKQDDGIGFRCNKVNKPLKKWGLSCENWEML